MKGTGHSNFFDFIRLLLYNTILTYVLTKEKQNSFMTQWKSETRDWKPLGIIEKWKLLLRFGALPMEELLFYSIWWLISFLQNKLWAVEYVSVQLIDQIKKEAQSTSVHTFLAPFHCLGLGIYSNNFRNNHPNQVAS